MNVCGRDIKIRGRFIRIAQLEGDKYEFIDDPEAMLAGLRNCGKRVDLFTFIQKLPEKTPQYSYPMEWDNFAVVPVSTFDHWWTKQIRPEARNRARQAEKKGVTIREVAFDDSFVQGMWEVYNESPVRQGKRNLHYGKDVETVRREASPFLHRSVFIGAFLDSKLIGFIKLVTDESGKQANLMHIVSMVKYRDKAPTNALIAHAVRACADRGISYLAYQSLVYGQKRDSLTTFKEVNGFQQFDLPRYYVPLSLLGRVAFSLGLHHKLGTRIPESVLAKLRNIRSAWYNRKLRSVREAS